MLITIDCPNHPRDMGEAQGEALRSEIRHEATRLGLPTRRSRMPSLRSLTIGPVRSGGAGREMLRHFAHLSERIEGLARAADLPFDTILDMHLRLRAGGGAAGLLSRRAHVRASDPASGEDAKRVWFERSLPRPASEEAGWILRESRPAVGFKSVEVTLPWLVTSVAGVNEGGVAVVAAPLLWGRTGNEGRPSSMLLVQESLQRFEDLEGAIGWCCKRPVEGEQSIVLGDASGAVATVATSGTQRRVQHGEGELHLEGGDVQPDGFEGAIEDSSDRVRIDARARRLWLEIGGASLEVEVESRVEAEGESDSAAVDTPAA